MSPADGCRIVVDVVDVVEVVDVVDGAVLTTLQIFLFPTATHL